MTAQGVRTRRLPLSASAVVQSGRGVCGKSGCALSESPSGRLCPLERWSPQQSHRWSVRKSRGSESVLGTFVLDSPSKVLFSSVLTAQLWRQPLKRQAIVRKSSGFLRLWPEASVSRLWRVEEPEAERRGAEGRGLHCLGQDAAAGRGLCGKKWPGLKEIRRPIGFARWSLWWGCRGEWVCPGYICSGLPLQSSFLLVLGGPLGRQPLRRSEVAVIK